MQKIYTFNLLLISSLFSLNAQAQEIDKEPCLSSSWGWAKAIISDDSYGNSDIFAGPDGNLYATGSFTNTITLGDSAFVSIGETDVYLLKYNADGQLLWSKVFGSKGYDEVRATVSDNNGNVYLTGTFLDTLIIENQQIVNFNGSPDIFLAKFNTQGNLVWLKQYGGSGYDYPGDLVIDGEGALYLSGAFEGSAEIGGTIINSATKGNSFLLKLNALGERIWLSQFGDVDPTNTKLAVKSTNNIVVGGNFSGNLNIQSETLERNIDPAAFVAEFSSDGTLVWLKQVTDGLASGFLASLAVDRADDIYIGGNFFENYMGGEFQVGDSLYTGSGAFLAKFESNGVPSWSTRLTTEFFNFVSDIAIDNKNNVFATGLLTSSLDFGGENYTGFGGYVAKYSEHGEHLKFWETGSFSYEQINLISADLEGNIYCTGVFEGVIAFDSHNLLVEGGYSDAFIARLDAGTPVLAQEPDSKSRNIAFYRTSGSSVDISWDSGDGNGRVMVMREFGKANIGSIVDGNIYEAGNGVFGEGSKTGTNQFVVYKGSANSATITGLKPNRVYSVAIFEYNEDETCSGTINYKTDRYATAYLGMAALNVFHSNFKVYPNPVGNDLNIILNTPYRGKRNFKLIDQKGRVMHTFTAEVTEDVTNVSIDLSRYQMRPGTYFLKVNDKNMKHDTFRVLKK